LRERFGELTARARRRELHVEERADSPGGPGDPLRFGGETWGDQCARILAGLPDEVYVSFDIDGLDPAYCPHTGTPVPGGLSFAQATYLLRALGESGRRIVGFDLNEVAPGPEGDDWDGNVGARLLYKLIGWTLRSQTRT